MTCSSSLDTSSTSLLYKTRASLITKIVSKSELESIVPHQSPPDCATSTRNTASYRRVEYGKEVRAITFLEVDTCNRLLLPATSRSAKRNCQKYRRRRCQTFLSCGCIHRLDCTISDFSSSGTAPSCFSDSSTKMIRSLQRTSSLVSTC